MRDKWMAPEWLACPGIPQYSIGWRMGYGEDYVCKLGAWLDELSEKTILAMRASPNVD